MSYRLSLEDPDRQTIRNGTQSSIRLPQQTGSCRTERLSLEAGMELLVTRYLPRVDLQEETRQSHADPALVITLGMLGNSGLTPTRGRPIAFTADHTTIACFQDSTGVREYRAGEPVIQLRLVLRKNVLERYYAASTVSGLLCSHTPHLIANDTSKTVSRIHAHGILHEMGAARRASVLRLHVQTLNLMSQVLCDFESDMGASRSACTDDEYFRLEKTRLFMTQNLGEPLTVGGLARITGMNATRFKKAFLHCYSTSPYQMLLNLRMRKAHDLLEQTSLQVSQVAWQIGYQYPENFSTAFVRFFGYRPKKVKRL